MEIVVNILPSGEIMIDRSPNKQVNDVLLSLLGNVVSDRDALNTFLRAAEECEQVFGDEQLCG